MLVRKSTNHHRDEPENSNHFRNRKVQYLSQERTTPSGKKTEHQDGSGIIKRLLTWFVRERWGNCGVRSISISPEGGEEAGNLGLRNRHGKNSKGEKFPRGASKARVAKTGALIKEGKLSQH